MEKEKCRHRGCIQVLEKPQSLLPTCPFTSSSHLSQECRSFICRQNQSRPGLSSECLPICFRVFLSGHLAQTKCLIKVCGTNEWQMCHGYESSRIA